MPRQQTSVRDRRFGPRRRPIATRTGRRRSVRRAHRADARCRRPPPGHPNPTRPVGAGGPRVLRSAPDHQPRQRLHWETRKVRRDAVATPRLAEHVVVTESGEDPGLSRMMRPNPGHQLACDTASAIPGGYYGPHGGPWPFLRSPLLARVARAAHVMRGSARPGAGLRPGVHGHGSWRVSAPFCPIGRSRANRSVDNGTGARYGRHLMTQLFWFYA